MKAFVNDYVLNIGDKVVYDAPKNIAHSFGVVVSERIKFNRKELEVLWEDGENDFYYENQLLKDMRN